MFGLSILICLLTQCHIGLCTGLIPDTAESSTSCPGCELSFRSDDGLLDAAVSNVSFGVVESFVEAVLSQEPDKVVEQFCTDASLWGTVSKMARYTKEEIYSYFDYFAREDNEILSVCPQVISIGDGLNRVNVAVNNLDRCLRMSFVVNPTERCIANLYSSYFPNDPDALRLVDERNDMPWSGEKASSGSLIDPSTDPGDCASCDLQVRGTIPEQDIEGAQGVLESWGDGLIQQNSTQITDTYCKNAFLWGTVSNARRNTYEEIKSYFDWFANSRNFTEDIKSVCDTLSKLSDNVFIQDRELRLGTQCIRMSFIIANEDGNYCVKSLSSSYFPSEPAALKAADAKNLGPPSTGASLISKPSWYLSVPIAAIVLINTWM